MKPIADSTVRRLSIYLRFLEERLAAGDETISSDALARLGGTTSAQVRKDLSFFGSFGTRGLGYGIADLAERIRAILGLEREWRVAIVGAGKIGAALAGYPGFAQRGFHVVAAFDADPSKVGKRWGGLVVRDANRLAADLAADLPDIAVLAVPAEGAQALVDVLVAAGVRAILNFAPTPLHVPAGVTLKSVNMAMELETLSYALAHAGAKGSGAGQPAAKSRSTRRA